MAKPYSNPYAHPDLDRFWQVDDAGRKVSIRGCTKRGEQKLESNDCTVRALKIALGVSYDEAHEFCATTLKRPRNGRCDLPKLLRTLEAKGALLFGHTVKWVSCPATAGQTRMDAYKLLSSCALHGKRAIVRESHHVWGVRDGIGHDTHMPYAGRCVYGYWVLTPSV